MNFLTYGDKNRKAILFIHGMATTARICYEPLLPYLKDYYVILAEVDGHSENTGELRSVPDSIAEIEDYVLSNLNGELYCLSGFSLGATMAVEIVSRGRLSIEKVHLDAPFLVRMGLKAKPFEWIFCGAIAWLKKGRRIPRALTGAVMGKGNNSAAEMLYRGIASDSIRAACEFVYRYMPDKRISAFPGQIVCWYGTNERYPKQSAGNLRCVFPRLETKVFGNMGHGQYLHEHSGEYARLLIEWLEQ